jgi:chemosensory pili system protein ChpA (sensor histidine kinase/response regulator)
MDRPNPQNFLDDAESSLSAIRASLLMSTQEPGTRSLEEALRHVQALQASAADTGMVEIGGYAGKLAADLEWIVSTGKPQLGDVTRPLLDILAKVQAGIGKARMDLEDAAFDVSHFVDESFDNLISQQAIPIPSTPLYEIPAEEEQAQAEEDEFEIDEEMIEIFQEEAEELLANINGNLGILANEANNREALLEIRRSAHTFKGSAGIVGLKKPSLLAHRMEDLLDHLAENQIDGDERIFELLLTSTDCLSSLTHGENSPQTEARVARIYEDFDSLMTSLAAGKVQPAQPEPAPAVEPPKPEISVHPTQPIAPQNRPVVRVSLERLDDLATLVRGLVTTRSIFEQRLAEFEQQVQELHNTTRRLQRSSSKLETDFEANMLGSGTHRRSGLVTAGAPAGLTEPEFDALEFDHYTEFHQTTRELVETTSDNFAINSALDTIRGNLEGLFENQRRLTEELQDRLQRIRMIEFGTLSARLNRTIRVTCEEEEKQADLFITGEHIEIDTQILDSLIEPLMHLLRNAVAHGIEPPEMRRLLGKMQRGRIELNVRNEETHIVLTISDDGRGIMTSELKDKAVRSGFLPVANAASLSEEDILELVFHPGLTTAETVSQTAGRGVGMNIVRTSIERQQGTISIASEPQRGTTFTLRLPVSLAITKMLLVKANRQAYAFPLKFVSRVAEIGGAEALKALQDKAIQIDGKRYPMSSLNEHLGFQFVQNTESGNHPVLLMEVAERSFALLVDEVVRPEEIVVKSLGSPFEQLRGILGATILGNGQVVPVLDIPYFLRARGKKAKPLNPPPPVEEARQLSVMIVDDSPSVRHLNTRLIRNAGWSAVVAKDGLEAVEMLQAEGTLPDVILSDVEMPRMDGYELLSTVRNNDRWKNIPVVMITSRAGEKHRQKALDLKVSEYLVKPYDDATLLNTVKLLVDIS